MAKMAMDALAQQLDLAAKHLATLEQQTLTLPEQPGALDPALRGLAATLLALQQGFGDLARQNEACSARCQELEAECAYYRSVFEFAPHARLLTDLDGLIQSGNAPASELLGVPQESLIHQPLSAFLSVEDQQSFGQQLERLRSGEAVRDWEAWLQTGGATPPVSLDAVPIRSGDRSIVGAQWLVRDISRQAAAEEALHRSEHLLRSFVEQSRDGIALTDEQGLLIEWNAAMEQATGLPAPDVLGRPMWEVELTIRPGDEEGPEQAEQIKAGIQALLRSGQAPWVGHLLEREIIDPDGARRVVQGRVFPVGTDRGFLLGSISRDVTDVKRVQEERERLLAEAMQERRRAEDLARVLGEQRATIDSLLAQAQRQADEMAAIFASMANPVVVYDGEGRVVSANPMAIAMLGLDLTGQLIPAAAQTVVPRGPDGRLLSTDELVASRALRGETVQDFEMMIRVAGEDRHIVASGAPIVSGDSVQGAVLSWHDVTSLRQAEAEQERLLAENRAQREFLESLVETAPVGIAVLRGPEHRYELANPYYRAMTGAADRPIIGRTIVEAIPDLPARGMPPLMDQVYRTGQTVSTREVLLSIGPGREETYWNTDRVPLHGPDGAVDGILVLAWEVTHEVQARQRIEALSAHARRQADEMGAVFGALVEPVMVFDASGAILRANPAAVEALGVDPVGLAESQLGQRMSVRHPDGRPIPADVLVAARALRGERVRDDYQRLDITGRGEHAIVASAAPIFSGDQISGAVIAWHDITELRRTETALRASEEKLRTLVELLPIGVSVLDGERRIRSQNAALQRILGLEPEGVLRGEYVARTYLRSDGTVMPPDEFPSNRAFREQRPVRSRVGIVKENGATVWTDVSAVPVPLEDWKVVVATLDITVRKEAEDALRRARDELEARVQARTRQLSELNQELQAQIAERTHVEEALRLSEQRLELRVAERTRELATLLDISNTVALTMDLEPLLALILEKLKDVVDYDGGGAFRLEAGTLSPVFHRGAIPPDDLLRIGSRLEEVVLGHAVIQGPEPVILTDVQGQPALQEAFRRAAGAQSEPMARAVRAWMAVPVTIKQQVYGVLYMYHSQPGCYAEEQARMALPFGNQAAVAIENARLYEQAQRLAALEERQHLARELHDAVTQTLFSASLAAEVLPRLWERDREAGLLCLAEVHQLTRGALAEMRTLLLELRPSALAETELGALLRQLAEAVCSRVRIPVTVQAVPQLTLPAEVQVALFRIAQEALNNITKHARAQHVAIELVAVPSGQGSDGATHAARVELSIADDGCGFDLARQPAGSKGLGVSIMRERAGAIGAAFEIHSQPGQGTRITIGWPSQESWLGREPGHSSRGRKGTK
jgi:PAS domain S-box-containing protein